MSLPQTAAIQLAAASATAVCASQTPAAAGAMAVNGGSAAGGVATLDAARRVLVTTTGNETGKTIVLRGTDRAGVPIIETLALPNTGTVQSLQDFGKVTLAAISAAAAAPISIGTSSTASTRWIKLDYNRGVFNNSVVVNFGGVAATAAVETTLDSVDKAMVDAAPGGNSDSSAAGLGSTTFVPPAVIVVAPGLNNDQLVDIGAPVRAVRLTVTAGAATPGVRVSILQQGV